VQLRKQMLDRMRQREKMRNQLVQVDGDVSEKSVLNTMMFQQQQTTDKIEAQNKVDIFENGFRKIKEATGVSDVNDVIEKITSQESSLENLVAITKENQAKIEGLKDVRRTTKANVEAVKYSGASGGHRRKLVDDHEDQLANSATRLDRSKLKFERLTKVIISMKGGVGHLQEKLGHFGGEGVRTIELRDDTVVEVLRECEASLTNLVRRLEGGADGRKSRGRNSGTDSTNSTASISLNYMVGSEMSEKEGGGEGGGGGALDSAERSGSAGRYRLMGNISPSIRPYNQRIDLAMNNEEESESKNHSNESNSGGDFEDEEITREKVKRASSQILATVNRKKKPKKKGAVGTGLSVDDM
jgi:coiled-coil domain-containing protein 151